jgi:hypothetical protein
MCGETAPDDQELAGVVETTIEFEHDDRHDDPADDRAAAKGGPAMTRDREFRQLGIDDAAAGRPRYRFHDAHLQQLYDWGFDFEEEVRRAEIAAGFHDSQDDGGS